VSGFMQVGKEREIMALQGRETSSSPAFACQEEEEEPPCRSKRHHFGFFFSVNSA